VKNGLNVYLIYNFVVRVVADKFLTTAHTPHTGWVHAVIQAVGAALKTVEWFFCHGLNIYRPGLVHTPSILKQHGDDEYQDNRDGDCFQCRPIGFVEFHILCTDIFL